MQKFSWFCLTSLVALSFVPIQGHTKQEQAAKQTPQTLAEQIDELDVERNAKLREIIKNNPNAPISSVLIQLFSVDCFSPEEKEVWNFLNSLEMGIFANSAAEKPYYNLIQSLDPIQEEFAMKRQELHSAHFAGKKVKETTLKELGDLETQRLAKVLSYCKTSSDPFAKKVVAHASTLFPKYAQAKLSAMYIFSLVQNETSPRDNVEKEVKEVLQSYSLKKRKLMSSKGS